jgi:hypothetical protein
MTKLISKKQNKVNDLLDKFEELIIEREERNRGRIRKQNPSVPDHSDEEYIDQCYQDLIDNIKLKIIKKIK